MAARGDAIKKLEPEPAEYIEPGSVKHTHIHPETGAYISAVTRPKGRRSASITDLYVPEEHRNRGIGKMLLNSMMTQFPSMQGQVSSKAAAKNAYASGRRMAGNEDASLEDIYKKIDEDSSVNMWTPKAEGGSVDEDRQKNLSKFLEGNHPEIPHVVYHGTGREHFKNNKFEAPSFFTSDANAADWFAKNRGDHAQIFPVHLSMKNPLDARSKEGLFKLIDIAKKANVHTELNEDPRGWSFHSNDISKHSPYEGENVLDLLYIPAVREALKKHGHDGVIADDEFSNTSIPAFIPIESHQIKSAIGNRGTYDPNDPDITKAEGGSVDDDGITAYHGSPHDFDKFDISKIGTGEGAQAYGHGLYFAQHEPVAEGYRDELSKNNPLPVKIDNEKHHNPTRMQRMVADHFGDVDKVISKMTPIWERVSQKYHSLPEDADELERTFRNLDYKEAQSDRAELEGMRGKNVGFGKRGHMYEVHINAHPDHFLDWDKPLHEQPYVMDKLIKAGALKPDGSLSFMYNESPSRGGEMYERLTSPMAEKLTGGKSQKHASDFLHSIGIKGIKYFDAGSRGAGEGSRNYVVFDDKLVSTKRKYARGGIVNA